MVQIRTESIKSNKVSLVDLNKNVKELTETLREFNKRVGNSTSSVSSSSISNKTKKSSFSSSSSSSSKKNEESAIKEFLKTIYSGEVKKQSNNVFDTLIGGFTGISPAIIQRLNVTQALGSAIKKQWNNAKARAASSKVNSAIDENRKAGTNKRLDTIIGILKGSKKKQNADDKKQEGRFGQFLRTLGLFLGPLLKIAAGAALLGGIARAISWIARKFGWNPGENPAKDVTNINTIKDAIKLGKAGYEITKGKVLNKVRDIAQLRNTKKTAEAGALITKLEKDAARVEKARTLANEAREAGNIKRADKLDNIANAKERKVIKESQRIKELEARAAKDAAFAKRVEQIKNSRGLARTGMKVAGGFAVGTAIDAGASELAAWYLDKEGHHVEAESLRRQYKAVLPYNAIGTAGGAIVGGITGGASTLGVGTAGGAIAGGNIGYAITDLTISELVRAKENAKTYKEFGKALPKPERGEISPFRSSGDWYYYTKDQLERNASAPAAKEELKRIWKRVGTDYTKDKEYEGHGLIDRLPDGMLKDWAYRLDHGIGTAFSAIPETAGIGAAYLDKWWNDRKSKNINLNNINPSKSVSYSEYTTPIYGLTTDFNKPIQAADQAEKPTTELVENTKSTNEILQDILAAIQDNNNSNKGLFSSISNKLNTPQQSPAMPQGASAEGLDGLPSLSYLTSHGRIMNYEF